MHLDCSKDMLTLGNSSEQVFKRGGMKTLLLITPFETD